MRLIPAALVILVCLASPATMFAQSSQASPAMSVPRLINISGVYRPVNGQPLTPAEDVTLAIYAQETGGTPLWQETQRIAVDAEGRYTVLLGATQPDGVPLDVFASGQAQWLGITFHRPGDVEGARMRITSVPYALHAADAVTLGGRPASDYVLTPTKNGLATTSAASTTASADTAVNALNVVLAGTPNALAKYVDADNVGASAVSEANGRVGINTGAPADYLHIRFTDPFGAFTGLAVQNLSNNANAASGMLFYDHNGALTQFQGFNNTNHAYVINNVAKNGANQFDGSYSFLLGSTPRFVVASNGNVGIGTTTPAFNLEVSNVLSGTGTTTIANTTYGNSSFGPIFSGRKARGTAAAPNPALTGDALATLAGRGWGTTAFGGAPSGSVTVTAYETFSDTTRGTALTFATTPRGSILPTVGMTLNPEGNLGLGTSDPGNALEIVRSNEDSFLISTSFSGESGVFLVSGRGTAAAPAAVQTGDTLGFVAFGGVDSTTDEEPASIVGSVAVENWTGTAHGSALGFLTTAIGVVGAQINMAIRSDGNVGIGTPADAIGVPTALDKLQVFGDIRIGTTGTNGCLRNFAGTGLIGACASDRRFKRDSRHSARRSRP